MSPGASPGAVPGGPGAPGQPPAGAGKPAITALTVNADIPGIPSTPGGPIPAPSPGTAAGESGVSIHVNVQASNFELVAPTAQPGATPAPGPSPAPGAKAAGAIHFSTEGDATPGGPEIQTETEYTWMNVPPGTNTFRIELVDPQNNPLEPPAFIEFTVNVPDISEMTLSDIMETSAIRSAMVEITDVGGGAPMPASPAPGASPGAAPGAAPGMSPGASPGAVSSVMMSLQTSNFQLIAPAMPGSSPSSPTLPPKGAVRFSSEDGASPEGWEVVSKTEYTWANVPPGMNTFRAELVTPQNETLSPAAFFEVTVNLPERGAGAP